MIFDTHVHMTHFDEAERERQIAVAKSLGSRVFIEVGTTAENSKEVVALAGSRDDTWCGVAVHPNRVHTWSPGDVDTLRGLLQTGQKIVCIGECGLDYSQASPETAERQREVFRQMIRLAREFRLPLNMHTDRLSSADHINILREERAFEVGGMMHNFMGNAAMARELHDMGFYVSSCVTFFHPMAQRLRSVWKELPLGQIVVDSDAPGAKLERIGDSTEPYPHDMDKHSDLRMARYIVDHLAELKGIPAEDVEIATTLNAERLFGVKAR